MHRLFLSRSIESSQHVEMLRHSSPCGSDQDVKVISSALCTVYHSVHQISMTFEREYIAAVICLGRVCE